jgi:hypothetical protein
MYRLIRERKEMAIRQKIDKKPASTPSVEKVIERGGHVAADRNNDQEWTNFCLRIRKDIVERMEGLISQRLGMTKTGWILEAIQEKLKRDE